MTENGKPVSTQEHLRQHIDLIARHEQEFLDRRSSAEKLSDRMASFIGSLPYVGVHIVVFFGWIAWNTLPVFAEWRFDPAPFPMLDLLFAFEAILVVSLILMRQTRMSRRADERDHLMLQVLLLTEREITAVLGMDREMAQRMGMHDIAGDREITQLSEQTSIDEVVQSIKETLPME